jgi:predicted alpha/beta-hydrolase family hydrolase
MPYTLAMEYLAAGPEDARAVYLFAHGAGAPMDHPFMSKVARGLGERGIRVVRFEFLYMAARRAGTKKGGAPDRPAVLLDTWRQAIADHGGGARVAIGGKSMGGRIATMVADEMNVRGVVVFGYPFHPPGRPQQLRTAHLEQLRTRTLIVQGTRDEFGARAEVESYALSPSIRIEWIEGGRHSLTSDLTHPIEAAAAFLMD